jgi:hypothetical protein
MGQQRFKSLTSVASFFAGGIMGQEGTQTQLRARMRAVEILAIMLERSKDINIPHILTLTMQVF